MVAVLAIITVGGAICCAALPPFFALGNDLPAAAAVDANDGGRGGEKVRDGPQRTCANDAGTQQLLHTLAGAVTAADVLSRPDRICALAELAAAKDRRLSLPVRRRPRRLSGGDTLAHRCRELLQLPPPPPPVAAANNNAAARRDRVAPVEGGGGRDVETSPQAPPQRAEGRLSPPRDAQQVECRSRAPGGATFIVHPISFGYPAELIPPPPGAAAGVPCMDPTSRPFPFFPFVTPYWPPPLATAATHSGPGDWPTLDDPRDEPLIHEAYRRSVFVLSHKRGGWDCWRLLEALAAGALPFIPDLPGGCRYDPLCLGLYPVALFDDIRQLAALRHLLVHAPTGAAVADDDGDDRHHSAKEEGSAYFINASDPVAGLRINPLRMPAVNRLAVDWAQLQKFSEQARRHVREHMTTAHVARRVLLRVVPNAWARLGSPSSAAAIKVLLVLRNQPTYMSVALEHGLDSLGVNYTATFDRPYLRRPALVKDAAAWDRLTEAERDRHREDSELGLRQLHGKGVGYSFRMGPLRNPVAYVGRALTARILKHGPATATTAAADDDAFDAIVYAFHEPPALASMPMLRAITAEEHPRRFPKGRVAIVDDNDSFDGSDARMDWAAEAASVATLFRREPLRSGSEWACLGHHVR